MPTRSQVAETDRLILARPDPSDAPAVFAVHGDPATNLHNPHGPHRSLDESEAFLQTMLADWTRDSIGYCAVTRREDPGTVIGFAGIRVSQIEGKRVLNLYYRFTPSSWGYGFAGEAARTALGLARSLFPDTPVVALIREDNLPSRRLAERLGFESSHGSRDAEGRCVHVLSSPGCLTP
ncbi:ribosomal-protein-alanine N-acetyltransferase [Kitasatospora sp. MAP12-15]|uniref:GNAT family N-acetyltransferase n=1 Tax=unclassified Kitasatospora TaxID=2633591 RepID=UPI00247577D8|nr:GNAT family N-acetyltransferase [Kitasatospora sp. MAP12-44]MDH6113880.1 ribosomal-protein-alanine N-acetyltransferase [Kitasatospora sp. MAP12-44]